MFASFFGRQWDQMGQKFQYLAQKANFGPTLSVYGPKILIFRAISKSFGTQITKKTPFNLFNFFELFFSRALDQMDQKCPYLAKNAHIWPNISVLGQFWPFLAKNLFWGGWSKSFFILISRNQWDIFFELKTLTGSAQIGRKGRKCAISTQNFWYFGPKVNFLYVNCNFCGQVILPVCPGLQLSQSDHPKKKFRFRAIGHFSGLIPVFGRFGPFPNHEFKYP